MKIIAVIPARYSSSRFPGKPLADIAGKPMIWHVCNEARKVKRIDKVIVATDSEIILHECEKLQMDVVMTSDKHPTGTDRVAEVALNEKADLYVIVMGDEPLITPKDIDKLIDTAEKDSAAEAIMLIERFINPVDAINNTTIKIAVNDNNDVIFMSRSVIPYPKETLNYDLYKNVGCYALREKGLNYFRQSQPSRLERAEGIELLRMIENRKKVKAVLIESTSMSVDTPKDLERIRQVFKERESE